MSRTALKDDEVPERLLVLSSEEDYAICQPFLEKGAAIYRSKLLLNGIVTQRLEYERHRLFLDHVKRTRSTIWVKKDDNQYRLLVKGIENLPEPLALRVSERVEVVYMTN